MRVAVDAHAIGCHLTGNEVYVRSLLSALVARSPESEFIAYVSSAEAVGALPQRVRLRQVAGNPFLRLGGDLSRRVWQDRPDLLHVQYTAPLACPVPVVVSVHDVSFLEHPEYFLRRRAWQLRLTVRRTVRRAAKVITVSEFSRRAILRAYGELAEDRVVAIPNGPGGGFRPISRELAAAKVARRFHLDAPFLLTVGDLQPRKNQIGLIRAFAKLLERLPRLRHHLVLAGKDSWYADRVHAAARDSGVADRIHFLGFVADRDLLQLYNACELFVFPSFYEGFGLPALEAMACGRAVACSATSALPEVVDGAAILFDPHATEQIARVLADILLSPELRGRLERLGLQRAAHFSWAKAAEKTMEVFSEVASRHAAPHRAQVASAR